MTEIAKKPMSSTEDRISALPDHLLHHIMSSLELKEVMTTSFLSTRWKSLWTSVPTLDLGTWDGDTEEIIPTRITFFLLHYSSPKIKKFRAQFDYANLTDYHINSWIIFATQHDVEEFDLNLSSLHVDPGYKVPWRLLYCGSLEVLRLTFCVLNLQSVNLNSLKELHLDDVTVSDLNTSGCPVLESLFLSDCHTDGHLNIHSPNQKLRYLKIHDSYDVVSCPHTAVTIFAPNLQSIQLTGHFRHFYDVKNLSSLKSASFQVYKLDDGLDTMPLLKLFQRAIQVPKLKLSDWCIQVLDNWELIDGVTLPPFRATCLKLDTFFNKFSLRRMSYVLRKAQDLNSLTFDIHASTKEFQETWECIASLAYTLSTIQKLKTVEIHNFLGSRSSFLSELPEPKLREFVNEWEKEIKLVKYILGSCTALEKMNISTIKMPMMPCRMKREYLHAVERRLLAFPRASVNVELYISVQI